MVVGDLGLVAMADPHVRLQKKFRGSGDHCIDVCTPIYKPPDVTLGNQRYQQDLDMWSFGCVAAELYSRQPLIVAVPKTEEEKASEKIVVDAIAATVGRPGQEAAGASTVDAFAASWLDEMPFFKKWYGQSGQAWLTARAETSQPWPPPCLEGCPEGFVQLVQNCLLWNPSARMTTAQAKTNSFLQPPGQLPLHVRLATQRGKNGVGTIAQADLDPDLLRYLQTCPSWNSLAKQRLETGAIISKCVMTEIAGIVDEENPPKCRSLNRDKDLELLPSERFPPFARALRKKWRPWLQQVDGKMREAVMQQNAYQKNGPPILEEDFADNAFAYASIQLMQPGARDDGWHTDGGCSLRHASATIFGTRSV